MADYCTATDVRNLAEPLARVSGSTYDVPTAVLTAAITNRSAYVDARLREQYVVPFSATYDALIVYVTAQLAAVDGLRYAQAQVGNSNPLAETLQEEAEATLDKILDGTISLSVARRTAVYDQAETAVSPLLDADHAPAFLRDVDDVDPLSTYAEV